MVVVAAGREPDGGMAGRRQSVWLLHALLHRRKWVRIAP
jgi:hypothetical protein